jgi:hypothetical protein
LVKLLALPLQKGFKENKNMLFFSLSLSLSLSLYFKIPWVKPSSMGFSRMGSLALPHTDFYSNKAMRPHT